MDAVYLLIIAGLYAITHALVWALQRLGKTP
jgi:cytochrome P450